MVLLLQLLLQTVPTITFNDVGDSVLLVYNTTGGWALVSNTGCTIA